jgi:hypothetical protein
VYRLPAAPRTSSSSRSFSRVSFPGVPESAKILLEGLLEKVERAPVRKFAGLGVGGLGLELRVQGAGCRVQGARFRFWGLGFGV